MGLKQGVSNPSLVLNSKLPSLFDSGITKNTLVDLKNIYINYILLEKAQECLYQVHLQRRFEIKKVGSSICQINESKLTQVRIRMVSFRR